jgi:signal peptidase I
MSEGGSRPTTDPRASDPPASPWAAEASPFSTHDHDPGVPPADVEPPGRALRPKDDEPQPHSLKRTILSWAITIVIAVVATLCVRAWVFEQYSIPSGSMIPTLQIGDRVIVSKLNKTPGRGDVVVFNRPANDPPASAEDPKVLIKRVIGLPGETVEARNGKVYVDGKPLDESYLPKGTETTIAKPITVPKGEILVLGDNRTFSQDGRYFGPIPESLIVGRAILRIWPLSRFGTL